MAKRNSLDGSVYRSPEGGWIAALDVPAGPGGRRIRKKRRARTRTEAQALLRSMRAELDRNGSLPDGTRTVAQTVASYRRYRESQQLAPSTKAASNWMLDLIEDGLGHRRLGRLSVVDCDEFLRACAGGLVHRDGRPRKPVGREHLNRIRATLIAAIRHEIRVGHVALNVAELSVMPEAGAAVAGRRALTLDELGRLLALADGAVRVLVDLSGRNGLRPAEARGLQWSDIDLAAGLLRVKGQLDENDELAPPKTKASARALRLDVGTVDLLGAWRTTQERLQRQARVIWLDQDLVATTNRGTPINRNNYRRSLRALCLNAEILPPITPYELRHTAISHQADQGHSSWQIADWAGTSERMISERYRHKLSGVSQLEPVYLPAHEPGNS